MTKVTTYCELDLDLYRSTIFEMVLDGGVVDNWSIEWTGANGVLTGAIDAVLPFGKGMELFRDVATGTRNFAMFNTMPSVADISTIGLYRALTGGLRLGTYARAAPAALSNGYICVLNGTSILLQKSVAGVDTTLISTLFTADFGVNYWVRFDTITISGPAVLLRAKVWTGTLSDEPSLFMISFEDTTTPILAAGRVGVHMQTGTFHQYCGYFRARSILGSLNETLRFATPSDYLPVEPEAIPNLSGVNISPQLISLGTDLGKRANVSVELQDHKHADLGELFNSGSMWGKFRARNLFRRGNPLRVLRPDETRHFVLESFNGPTPDGRFSFTAQDIVKFADNDRAQAPRVSNGFLAAGITNVATSATLSPAGIGNEEYPTSGFVAIGGEEICAFTRVNDTLTITRAQFGTVAVAHDSEDRVQVCLEYDGENPATIINDLFTTYAEVSSSYIDLAAWTVEVDTYLQRLYTRLIAEPTGVNKLVSELIEQAGLVVWTDDKNNQIRLRVLRGIDTNAFMYTPDNMLAGTLAVQEQPGTRVTQVWTYYGVRNPLDSLTEAQNYRSTFALIDTEQETIHGGAIIKKIFASWIPAFARQNAERLNNLVLGRFAIPPRKFSFSVLRYSGINEPILGEGYRFKAYSIQDEAGNLTDAPIQVTRINPTTDRWVVDAEEMLFTQFDPQDLIDRVITIDAAINNFNLKDTHDSIYPALTPQDVYNGATLTCIINEGVIVGSNSTSLSAFDVGTGWPADFPITLIVIGRIQGCGGNGRGSGSTGLPGGIALFCRFDINLDVDLGEIFGGAGGGGSSGGVTISGNTYFFRGGGGAGQIGGLGGANTDGQGTDAQPGTSELGGDGGKFSGLGELGGHGGNPGLNGSKGDDGDVSNGKNGGAAGSAIDGISFINVIQGPGDIRGPQIN